MDHQQTVLSLMQKTGAICQNLEWFGLSNFAFCSSLGSEQRYDPDAALCHGNQHSLHHSAHLEHGVWDQGSYHLPAPMKMRMDPTESIMKNYFIQKYFFFLFRWVF